jgi:hypothetical protein
MVYLEPYRDSRVGTIAFFAIAAADCIGIGTSEGVLMLIFPIYRNNKKKKSIALSQRASELV